MRRLAFICIGLASERDVIQLTYKGKQQPVLCVPRSCKQGEAISDRVKLGRKLKGLQNLLRSLPLPPKSP